MIRISYVNICLNTNYAGTHTYMYIFVHTYTYTFKFPFYPLFLEQLITCLHIMRIYFENVDNKISNAYLKET